MWLARVDLAWLAERVIVAYDGIVHLDNAQRLRDAARRNALQGAGWLVITFTSADLGKPLDVILMVRRALVSRRSLAR
jgi:very-short-patch-repair endonuclease